MAKTGCSTFHLAGRGVLLGVSLLLVSATAGWALDPVVCIDENQFVQPPQAPPVAALGVTTGGEIYEGATPPGLDPGKPVLVFVHGLHGSIASWNGSTEYYGHNDMYDSAYAAGYKTFFVDLWDAEGEARNSITNGKLLRRLVRHITLYWGVDKVNIVAHSKGGVDSNVAALLSQGQVDSVFTLSSPHWGSPLADLAQSSFTGWLAELLGFNDEGTKFLQTACMSWFRGKIDWRPANANYSVYTTAATGWGPLLSALEFGGLYLATVCPGGDNDGLVCIEHAEHPWGRDAGGAVNGEHRLVWDASGPDFEADHDNVRVGNAFMDFTWFWEPDDCYIPIFGSIEPYVGVFHGGSESSGENHAAGAAPIEAAYSDRRLQTLLRGGPIDPSGTAITFPVEPGVSTFVARLLLGPASGTAVFRSPDGRAFELPSPRPSGGVLFSGALATGVQIDRPRPGEWRLELASDAASAFLLLGVLDAELDVRLTVAADGADRHLLSVSVAGSGIDELRLEGELRGALAGPATGTTRREIQGDGSLLLIEPGGDGVHNLSLTVRGTTADGSAFERSAVVSLATGIDGSAKLPEFCE